MRVRRSPTVLTAFRARRAVQASASAVRESCTPSLPPSGVRRTACKSAEPGYHRVLREHARTVYDGFMVQVSSAVPLRLSMRVDRPYAPSCAQDKILQFEFAPTPVDVRLTLSHSGADHSLIAPDRHDPNSFRRFNGVRPTVHSIFKRCSLARRSTFRSWSWPQQDLARNAAGGGRERGSEERSRPRVDQVHVPVPVPVPSIAPRFVFRLRARLLWLSGGQYSVRL